MQPIDLKNKPLVEAIFELRWNLEKNSLGIPTDPNYKILTGMLFDKMRKDYGIYEQLPSANIPEEMSAYVVQHRFRHEKNGWPLVQIGPGIVTLNDTAKYRWGDFSSRIKELVDSLLSIDPGNSRNFVINSLLLRYIDAIDFDMGKDVLQFLKEKMNLGVCLNPKLFEDSNICSSPNNISVQFSFKSIKPHGIIATRFANGQNNGKNSIIWETFISTNPGNVPNNQEDILKWVSDAHSVSDDWFFKTIEGDLMERFK